MFAVVHLPGLQRTEKFDVQKLDPVRTVDARIVKHAQVSHEIVPKKLSTFNISFHQVKKMKNPWCHALRKSKMASVGYPQLLTLGSQPLQNVYQLAIPYFC